MLLDGIRADLKAKLPSIPAGSRVYFARIPHNIGLIAGQSPAIRVWYADTTLVAGFYSAYERRSREMRGEDFFFRFDSLAGLVRIEERDRPPRDQSDVSDWVDDRFALAELFRRSGELSRAAAVYENVARVPGRVDAILYAAVTHELTGHAARADSLYVEVVHRSDRTMSEVRDMAATLRSTVTAPSRRGPH
jgi:hypothetical protein